ncbi:MAG: metal ABC transporter permease [Rickettsiaceae bacterium]|nr:metal ABC transporter permease [Rickettsiaceae bacterium]
MLTIILVLVLLGAILAPLGCLMLWNRYTYYGDGLAHSSMFAIILSNIMNINLVMASLLNASIFTYLVYKTKKKSERNASISMISSLMVSASLVLSSLYPYNINLEQILFGDLMLVGQNDLYYLVAIFIVVVIFFIVNYKKLILIIISTDIAHLKGIKTTLIEYVFLLILSFSVICTIKIVGVLLVTSILIIPAMTARFISSTPLQMICVSVIIIQIMNISGIFLSFYGDLPFSPVIILSGGLFYSFFYFIDHKTKRIC